MQWSILTTVKSPSITTIKSITKNWFEETNSLVVNKHYVKFCSIIAIAASIANAASHSDYNYM